MLSSCQLTHSLLTRRLYNSKFGADEGRIRPLRSLLLHLIILQYIDRMTDRLFEDNHIDGNTLPRRGSGEMPRNCANGRKSYRKKVTHPMFEWLVFLKARLIP